MTRAPKFESPHTGHEKGRVIRFWADLWATHGIFLSEYPAFFPWPETCRESHNLTDPEACRIFNAHTPA